MMGIVENTLLLCAGYSLAHDGIQVVTKPDKEGTPVGTGVAYVRFSSPSEAESARKERHRQPMGTRYIECLPFTASHYTSPLPCLPRWARHLSWAAHLPWA